MGRFNEKPRRGVVVQQPRLAGDQRAQPHGLVGVGINQMHGRHARLFHFHGQINRGQASSWQAASRLANKAMSEDDGGGGTPTAFVSRSTFTRVQG